MMAIGGAAGAVLGGSGGLLGGFAQKREAGKVRKEVRAGVGVGQAETARQVGTIMSSPEFLAASKMLRGLYGITSDPRSDLFNTLQGVFGPDAMYGRNERGYGRNASLVQNANGSIAPESMSVWNESYLRERFGQRAASAEAALPGVQGRRDYLDRLAKTFGTTSARISGTPLTYIAPGESDFAAADADVARQEAAIGTYNDAADVFGGGAPMDTLTQDFVKGIRAAQSARGLYTSQVGAAQEASGLAAFRAQLQLNMLPQLLELAQAPVAMGQQYGEANLARNVFSRTGGRATYGQQVSGAYGGSPLGSAIMSGTSGLFSGASLGLSFSDLINRVDNKEAGKTTK